MVIRRPILIACCAAAAAVLVAASAGCAARHTQATPSRTPVTATRASKLPGIYLGAMAGPWNGPSVRPSELLLGADWTISKLRWTAWNQRSAEGRGLWVACSGASGPCDKFWAAITVSQVHEHDGARYFAIMRLAGRHHRVIWLVMNTAQGWWQQRKRP